MSFIVELEAQCSGRFTASVLLTRLDSKLFKRPHAFPRLGADVAPYAAQFKRLLGHNFLEAWRAYAEAPTSAFVVTALAASLASRRLPAFKNSFDRL
jgi:hypothetical protein